MGNLIHWLMTFAVIALISAVLAFGGVAGPGATAARALFWFALVVMVLTLIGTIMKHAHWRS